MLIVFINFFSNKIRGENNSAKQLSKSRGNFNVDMAIYNLKENELMMN